MASNEAINNGDVRWTLRRPTVIGAKGPNEAMISLDMSRSRKASVGAGTKNIRAKNIRTIGTRTGYRYF